MFAVGSYVSTERNSVRRVVPRRQLSGATGHSPHPTTAALVFDTQIKNPDYCYCRWWHQYARPPGARSYDGALCTGHNEAVQPYKATVAMAPQDALRQWLLHTAVTPEAFVAHRSAFTRSLAACNVFGYLAGVGDRHLKNILLDTATGKGAQSDILWE